MVGQDSNEYDDADADMMDLDDNRQTSNKEKVNITDLIKRVAQCILSSSTRRGYCRDVDIAEMFMDKKERELREKVLRKVQKELKAVFGFRMERDEESKRYYIYNDTEKNIGIKLAEEIKEPESLHRSNLYEVDEQYLENPHFKRWLLTFTLMFIFMSKRHTETNNQTEKGIDLVLIRNFLNSMFAQFDMAYLNDKEFGELFGPAKSAEFIAEGWLRFVINHDHTIGSNETTYFWGPRAEKTINKQQTLNEFCKIYGGNFRDWPNHAKVAGYRI